MKLRLLLIFSTIFTFFALRAFAQSQNAVASTNTGLSIYIDYGKLLTIPTDFELKGEAGISFQLKNRFAPHVQLGWARLEPGGAFENGSYTSEGMYARAGVNYLLPFDATNSFYIGVRYARSQFEETGSYQISSKIWPSRIEKYTRKDLQADWFEVVFGTEKRFKQSHWYLGGNISLRILNNKEKFSPIDTYAIPGYGRAFDQTVPALNVYLKYSF
ncbi:hypothetical protein C900_05193 [Fulvivirga imtechensis AK7]|uniref:Outer membrane protein beta-barrel domain-containing protein n=1 Tax=Fulvivirga imtechensis AK7 TaxID=1237149 RepID=L8JZP7_9BACT|nr:DUF6048 family protein [Fulvivirga imtechensis]ELR73144.1 hypothetical protein C900_05193 [Fulvivirga imtechensis AK7]